jgi:hypothetical protein
LDFHTGSPYPDDISSVLVDMDALAIIEHRSKKVYLYNQELDEKEGTISNRFTLKKVFHEMDRACTTSAAECLVVYFDILLDSHRIYSGLSHISPSLDLQASLFNIFEKIKLFVKDQRSEGYFYLYAGTPASIQHFNKTFNPEIFQQETNYRIDSKPRIQNSPAEPEEYPEYVNFYTFLDFALVEKVKADDEVVYYKQEFNFLSDLNEFDIQSPSLGYHSDSSMNTASSEETFRLSTSVVAAHSSNNDSNSSMESISSAETFRLSLPDITALTNNASSLSLDSVSSEENFRMPLSDTMVLNRR